MARNPASSQGSTVPAERLRQGGRPQKLTRQGAAKARLMVPMAAGELKKQMFPSLSIKFPCP